MLAVLIFIALILLWIAFILRQFNNNFARWATDDIRQKRKEDA